MHILGAPTLGRQTPALLPRPLSSDARRFHGHRRFIFLHDSGSLSLPEFPFLTTFGALSLALIEVKSICEKAEDKGDLRRAATLLSDLLSRFPTGLFTRRK